MEEIQEKFKNFSQDVAQIVIQLNVTNQTLIQKEPLLKHIEKYPKLTMLDIYKFILQGTCGWRHSLKLGNEKQLKGYLYQELIDASELTDTDEIFELLDINTGIGRVNLRSWKKQKGEEIDFLWQKMIRLELDPEYSLDLFEQRWLKLIEWINEGVISYPLKYDSLIRSWISMVEFMTKETRTPENLPLVSHSRLFRDAYKPSYRLMKEVDFSRIKLNEISKEKE